MKKIALLSTIFLSISCSHLMPKQVTGDTHKKLMKCENKSLESDSIILTLNGIIHKLTRRKKECENNTHRHYNCDTKCYRQ